MRSFNKTFVTILAVLAATPMLAGCEGIGWWNERGDTEQHAAYKASDSSALLNAPAGLQAAPGFAVSQSQPPMGTSPTPITPMYGTNVSPAPVATADPHVTLYPLDTAKTATSAQPPAANRPYPAASQWQASTVPPTPVNVPVTPPVTIANGGGKAALPPEVRPDVSRIYFANGSSMLNGENRTALNTIAEAAKFAPIDRVLVEGHASSAAQSKDIVTAKILNLKESMDRAQTVSFGLMEKGVPAEKIKTVAWGDTLPSGMGEAAQRRVDIITAAPGTGQ